MKNILIILLLISLVSAQEENKPKSVFGKIIEVETNKPIKDCLIFLYELDTKYSSMTISDEDGNFAFRDIKANFIELKSSRMGYDGANFGPVHLKLYDSLNVKMILTPIPHVTEDVVVEAEFRTPQLVKNGFYRRKDFGQGKFVTVKDIERFNLPDVYSIFRNFPGMVLQQGKLYTVRNTGMFATKLMNIYVDDMKINLSSVADDDPGFELEDFVNLDQILAVEVYSRPSEIPIKYKKFGSASGVVLIWTK